MTSQLRREQVQELQRVSAADPLAACGLRKDLERWLAEIVSTPLDEAVRADVVLTAAEALANSAEHAYAPQPPAHAVITLHVRYEPHTGSLTVCVGDQGRWKEPTPSASSPRRRGRGLTLMQRLSAGCRIDRRADGTTVCMDHHLT